MDVADVLCSHSQTLLKVRYLRSHMNRLSPSAFQQRKTYFGHPSDGVLSQEKVDPEASSNPLGALFSSGLMDPNGMSDAMKKNMFALASQMFFFTWIDRMFAGFISAKLPFGLTQGFKAMFQSGIDLQDLNVSYVSSLSWYILISSGLQGIIQVLLGADYGTRAFSLSVPGNLSSLSTVLSLSLCVLLPMFLKSLKPDAIR